MGKLSACRGHAGLIAHVRECGVDGRMRVIDVCAGVDIDDRPTSLLHQMRTRFGKQGLPVQSLAVVTPCDADAPGVADDPAGEGKRATVGESLRNIEKGG